MSICVRPTFDGLGDRRGVLRKAQQDRAHAASVGIAHQLAIAQRLGIFGHARPLAGLVVGLDAAGRCEIHANNLQHRDRDSPRVSASSAGGVFRCDLSLLDCDGP